jgi:hypothetical protein
MQYVLKDLHYQIKNLVWLKFSSQWMDEWMRISNTCFKDRFSQSRKFAASNNVNKLKT